jgi:hypothetical protein
MNPEARPDRPPPVAFWFVSLVVSGPSAEALLGDLLEEFCDLSTRRGVAVARRWFWRQSLKTIPYCVAAAFRAAPAQIAGAVLLGLVLRRFVFSNPESVVVAILRTQTPYSNLHYGFYVWLITWGLEIVAVVEALLLGCAVAAFAKGREIVATLAMSAVSAVFFAVACLLLLRHLTVNLAAPWPLLLLNLENWIAIVLGGVLVRKFRARPDTRFSSPYAQEASR